MLHGVDDDDDSSSSSSEDDEDMTSSFTESMRTMSTFTNKQPSVQESLI